MSALRFVVADDSNQPRDILRRVLRNGGYEVVEAVTSGSEAVAACRRHKPDVAVLDHSMAGGIQGAEAAKIILDEHLARAVVLASSMTQRAITDQVAAAGAAFIPKPYNKEEFLPLLRAFLRENGVESP